MDQWLTELPAGTLDRWFEYYKVEPWGDDWQRTSLHLSSLINFIGSLAPRGEGDEQPNELPADFFMPFNRPKNQPDLLTLAAEGLEHLPSY